LRNVRNKLFVIGRITHLKTQEKRIAKIGNSTIKDEAVGKVLKLEKVFKDE
jgi:hypothetical protein